MCGPVEEWAARRQPYLDNLKVGLIVAIITLHALLGYVDAVDVWPYDSVREVTLSPVTQGGLFVLVGPLTYFMIPLLFFVAGLLAPPSLERKGPRAYARDRLLRLGVPFAVYVGLVQPTLSYALEHPLGLSRKSYWEEYLGDPAHLEMGPLWFVGVLLIFSLTYAGLVALRPRQAPRSRATELRATHLLLLAATVAPATFLARLVYPIAEDSLLSGLNFWEWPASAAAFALGIAGSRRDWPVAVPDRLWRSSRTATLVALLLMGAYMALGGALGVVDEALGGWHWAAIGLATLDAPLALFGTVWLFGLTQRRLDRRIRLGAPLSRSAYGAFMLQSLVLIGLAVALRPLPLVAELKALIVAAGGVTGSFALAWLLVTRVPGVSRII